MGASNSNVKLEIDDENFRDIIFKKALKQEMREMRRIQAIEK